MSFYVDIPLVKSKINLESNIFPPLWLSKNGNSENILHKQSNMELFFDGSSMTILELVQ